MKILTEIWDFFKKNFGWLAIATVFLVLYLNGCFKPAKPLPPTITIVRDTVWINHDSTIYSHPTIITTNPPVHIPTIYLPDTNYAKLKQQYNELVTKYLSQNISKDSIQVDTLGSVTTTDTVSENKIMGRKWDYSLKERTITNTITITQPYKPHNQLFIGGGIEAIPNTNLISQVNAGLALKNKRDVILQGLGTYDFNQKRFGVQLNLFKLIKLK